MIQKYRKYLNDAVRTFGNKYTPDSRLGSILTEDFSFERAGEAVGVVAPLVGAYLLSDGFFNNSSTELLDFARGASASVVLLSYATLLSSLTREVGGMNGALLDEIVGNDITKIVEGKLK